MKELYEYITQLSMAITMCVDKAQNILLFPFTHFLLFFASSHIVQCAVFSQGVHCVSIQKFDGSDKASTGPAVMEVAVWVAVVNVRTYETLLVAQ